MKIEKRAHDIAIAFASVKMQARINSNNDDSHQAMEGQILEFITDYNFAFSNAVTVQALADNLAKE